MRILILTFVIAEALFFSAFADELDSISSDGLKACISEYRNGFYSQVVECINSVLPDLTSFNDSLEAYKVLALSFGMLNQVDKAKENFRLAFEKDSAMLIDTLAFPPNIALIFNQVKLENQIARLETAPLSQPQTSEQPPLIQKRRLRPLPVIFLSTAITSTGGAGALFYNGYKSRKAYSVSRNQDAMNAAWKEFNYSIAGGVGCTVISGVTTFLFFKVIHKSDAASVVNITGWKNGIQATINF